MTVAELIVELRTLVINNPQLADAPVLTVSYGEVGSSDVDVIDVRADGVRLEPK